MLSFYLLFVRLSPQSCWMVTVWKTSTVVFRLERFYKFYSVKVMKMFIGESNCCQTTANSEGTSVSFSKIKKSTLLALLLRWRRKRTAETEAKQLVENIALEWERSGTGSRARWCSTGLECLGGVKKWVRWVGLRGLASFVGSSFGRLVSGPTTTKRQCLSFRRYS